MHLLSLWELKLLDFQLKPILTNAENTPTLHEVMY